MEKEPIKCRITNMTYDKDLNLFTMGVQDLNQKRETSLAIKGTDFGITPELPIDIIEDFCKQMIGKEKNLHIEIDKSTLQNSTQEGQKLTEEKINEMNKALDQYPIREICEKISKSLPQDNNKIDEKIGENYCGIEEILEKIIDPDKIKNEN